MIEIGMTDEDVERAKRIVALLRHGMLMSELNIKEQEEVARYAYSNALIVGYHAAVRDEKDGKAPKSEGGLDQ